MLGGDGASSYFPQGRRGREKKGLGERGKGRRGLHVLQLAETGKEGARMQVVLASRKRGRPVGHLVREGRTDDPRFGPVKEKRGKKGRSRYPRHFLLRGKVG